MLSGLPKVTSEEICNLNPDSQLITKPELRLTRLSPDHKLCAAVLSCSVVSDSLRPYGL